MEQDLKKKIQHELKDFQITLMLAVDTMIKNKMNALTIAMQ